MTVKGVAFLARRRSLEGTKAGAELESLVEELAREHSIFAGPVIASTRIPVLQWIAFNETVIERYYGGDRRTYWRFGRESADFALAGPYRNLVENRDMEGYQQAVTTAWKVYYSHGRADGEWQGRVFRYRIDDVPVHHVYFEYTACSWVERGLELMGASIVETKAECGYSRGDERIEYHFVCESEPRGQ